MRIFIALFILITAFSTHAQIVLDNPSFEGEPEDATLPNGWLECKTGTTPDILPGEWGVYTEPSDGETYLGLITRQDKTWESVGQRLSSPLIRDVCYQFEVDLAHSKTYTGYNQPIKLRIWVGKKRCSRTQLIYESELINHSDWRTYMIEFTSKSNYNYIIFEAYFPKGYPTSVKGNVLIDNVSEIQTCKRA